MNLLGNQTSGELCVVVLDASRSIRAIYVFLRREFARKWCELCGLSEAGGGFGVVLLLGYGMRVKKIIEFEWWRLVDVAIRCIEYKLLQN